MTTRQRTILDQGEMRQWRPTWGLTANQETTSDRIETVVYSTTLGSTTSACRTMTIDKTTTTANVKGLHTASTQNGM